MRAMIAGTHAREGELEAAAIGYRQARDEHAAAVKLRPRLKSEHSWYVKQASTYELYAGLRHPSSAIDELMLASEHLARERYPQAVAGFKRALQSQQIREDLGRGALFQAACAAALAAKHASAAEATAYQAQSIEWLREDISTRRKRIDAIESETPASGAASKQDLHKEVRFHQEHLKSIQTSRFEFAELRTLDAFKELFP